MICTLCPLGVLGCCWGPTLGPISSSRGLNRTGGEAGDPKAGAMLLHSGRWGARTGKPKPQGGFCSTGDLSLRGRVSRRKGLRWGELEGTAASGCGMEKNSSQFHRGACPAVTPTLQLPGPFPQCGDGMSPGPSHLPQPQGTSLPTHTQAKAPSRMTLKNPIGGLALSPALEPMEGLNTAYLPLAVLCSPDVPSCALAAPPPFTVSEQEGS